MALSELEKERVIEELDLLEYGVRAVIIATLDAFTQWLAKTLYSIYQKIKKKIQKLWQWIRSQFL